jgi:dihydrofolate reductase
VGRVVVEQIVSVDGFAADAEGGLDFVEAGGDFAETEVEQIEFLRGVDAIVLGRSTYEIFAGYWPSADPSSEPIARPINELPKHVFSSTLESAPWGDLPPARLERADAARGVAELRERYTGDLVVWGSLRLTYSLFRAGVVDHVRLRVVPVLLGDGRPVTPADLGLRELRLVTARPYHSGHVALAYDVVR